MEFSDYSFFEHFGRVLPSYPPRQVLHDYILGRLKDILPHVRTNRHVQWIRRDEKRGGFDVQVCNLNTGDLDSESGHYDFVVVASGHYSVPNMPEFQGEGKKRSS